MTKGKVLFALAAGCLLLSILWFISLDECERPSTFSPNPEEVIRFSDTLAHHPDNTCIDGNSGLAIVGSLTFIGIALGLITLSSKRWIVLPVVLYGACFFCGALVYFGLGPDHTALRPIQTVEFDQRTYHLAQGFLYSMDLSFYNLFLFDCDSTGEVCHARTVYYSLSDLEDYSFLSVKGTANHLHVNIYLDKKLVYTFTQDNP